MPRSNWVIFNLSIVLSGLVHLIVLSSGRPALWGFLPAGSRALFWVVPSFTLSTLLAFLALAGKVEFLNRRVDFPARIATWSARPGWSRRAGKFIMWPLAYAAVVWTGWYLRSNNYFLGDGFACWVELTKDFNLKPTEPLGFFIPQLFYRAANEIGIKLGGGEAYALLYSLLLPIYLWVCWKIAARIASGAAYRLSTWLLLVFTGSLQFFFGYVENYTLLQFFTAFYIYFGLEQIAGRDRPPLEASLFFLLAAASHLSGVVLAPSLALLWAAFFKKVKRPSLFGSRSLLIGAVSLALFILLLFLFNTEYLVPLSGELKSGYTPYHLFDRVHLLEKFNFIVLASPVLVALLAVFVLNLRRIGQVESARYEFIFWVSAGTAFFTFIFDPVLGIRDWDLMSLPALPLTVFAVLTFNLLFKSRPGFGVSLAALALVCISHAFTWIWTNFDEPRGVAFLVDSSVADPHRGAGRLQFAYLLSGEKYYPESIGQYRFVTDKIWQNTVALNLADNFIRLWMPDSVLNIIKPKEALELGDKANLMKYSLLISAYEIKQLPDSAQAVYLRMLQRGISLDNETRKWLTGVLYEVSRKYKYSPALVSQPNDARLILFYLRYAVLDDNQNFLNVLYDHVLQAQLSPAEWKEMIRFAAANGHAEQAGKLLNAATTQYPDVRFDLDNRSGPSR
ncbi:MAG: hypothetical protein V1794_19195 [Candidatus Glassbacteria bacterium]